MSLRGDFAAFAGKESRKETLRKFSLEMGVNKEGTQSGWGTPVRATAPSHASTHPAEQLF